MSGKESINISISIFNSTPQHPKWHLCFLNNSKEDGLKNGLRTSQFCLLYLGGALVASRFSTFI